MLLMKYKKSITYSQLLFTKMIKTKSFRKKKLLSKKKSFRFYLNNKIKIKKVVNMIMKSNRLNKIKLYKKTKILKRANKLLSKSQN